MSACCPRCGSQYYNTPDGFDKIKGNKECEDCGTIYS